MPNVSTLRCITCLASVVVTRLYAVDRLHSNKINYFISYCIFVNDLSSSSSSCVTFPRHCSTQTLTQELYTAKSSGLLGSGARGNLADVPSFGDPTTFHQTTRHVTGQTYQP